MLVVGPAGEPADVRVDLGNWPATGALAWMPDGKRVVVAGLQGVVLVDLGKKAIVRRIDLDGSMFGISVSPAGRLAFASHDRGILVVDLRKKSARPKAVTHGLLDASPEWVGDDRLVFTRPPAADAANGTDRRRHVWIVDVRSASSERQLTEGEVWDNHPSCAADHCLFTRMPAVAPAAETLGPALERLPETRVYSIPLPRR